MQSHICASACALLLGCLVLQVAGNDFNLRAIHARSLMRSEGKDPANLRADDDQLWFTNRLDHFRAAEKRTFKQRYWVNDTFFGGEGFPVFVYVGGEGALRSSVVQSGEIVDLAAENGGLLLALEHRYYGLSHPFANLTTANLEFLTSQQALWDLAHFLVSMSTKHGLEQSSIVVVGGSYPGALSAWFRLKFPHIAAASLASSAPVEANENFFQYDQSVRRAAGPSCAQKLTQATQELQKLVQSEPSKIKYRFGCSEVQDDVSFMYVAADMAAYAIQYGLKDELCSRLEKTIDLVEAYAEYSKWLQEKLGEKCITFDITSYTGLQAGEGDNMRQWMWQSCNEFGYFQTAPAENPVRSPLITVDWHHKACRDLYGPGILPRTDATNAYYGGNKTAGSRIFFVNGSDDPWATLSVRHARAEEPSLVIAGTAHCADLHAPSGTDPETLTHARDDIARTISEWLHGESSDAVRDAIL